MNWLFIKFPASPQWEYYFSLAAVFRFSNTENSIWIAAWISTFSTINDILTQGVVGCDFGKIRNHFQSSSRPGRSPHPDKPTVLLEPVSHPSACLPAYCSHTNMGMFACLTRNKQGLSRGLLQQNELEMNEKPQALISPWNLEWRNDNDVSARNR